MNLQTSILPLLPSAAIPVILAGLTSCGSVPTAAKIGTASELGTDELPMLSANAPRKSVMRVVRGEIVSLNGQASRRSSVELVPGVNTVSVSYDWPSGIEQMVELKFRASEGRRYFIKYRASTAPVVAPSAPLTESLGYGLSHVSGAIGYNELVENPKNGPDALGWLGVPYLVGHVALAMAGPMESLAMEAVPASEGNLRKADYVDVMVVSDEPSEGVVRRVRAFPDGRTDAAPWDAYSNAPGT